MAATVLLTAGWVAVASSPSLAATQRHGKAAVVGGGVLSVTPEPRQEPRATIVADDGFRPEADGFGFENYGDKLPGGGAPDNLTTAQMRALFGDSVCADRSAGKCDLTPEASAWMDETNMQMRGGHCYGMSVLSLLLRNGPFRAADYGASATPKLGLKGNAALQRQIAYGWAFQKLQSVWNGVIKGTPNQVLNRLIELLRGKQAETWTIGFFNRAGRGGHAVTPYAVKDLGAGKDEIMIYDNNFPGATRAITVDTKADTWSYYATTVPGVAQAQYEGDAATKSLMLFPSTPGLSVQPSPFGSVDQSARAGSVGARRPAAKFPVQIQLTGSDPYDPPRLLLTDDAGHHTGFLNGQQVNTIAGASVRYGFAGDWQDAPSPSFTVPASAHVTLTVDGSTLKRAETADVTVIGNGYDLRLDKLLVRPGDRMVIDPAADGSSLRLTARAAQSAMISLGASYPDAEYTFTTRATIPADARLTMRLPVDKGTFSLNQEGGDVAGQYKVMVEREDSAGVRYAHPPAIDLPPGATATLDYHGWGRDGAAMPGFAKAG